jgi:aerobic C4-dicarboxylate transport protein
MSEARALTNFAGNAIATVLVGTWTNDIDRAKVTRVLSGDEPFDETVLVEDDYPEPSADTASPPARVGQGMGQTGRAPIAVSANQGREESPVS